MGAVHHPIWVIHPGKGTVAAAPYIGITDERKRDSLLTTVAAQKSHSEDHESQSNILARRSASRIEE